MWRPIELRKSSITADCMFSVTKSMHYISHADQPHCWNGHTLLLLPIFSKKLESIWGNLTKCKSYILHPCPMWHAQSGGPFCVFKSLQGCRQLLEVEGPKTAHAKFCPLLHDHAYPHFCVLYLNGLNELEKEYYSEVIKVAKLILVMPAANAL